MLTNTFLQRIFREKKTLYHMYTIVFPLLWGIAFLLSSKSIMLSYGLIYLFLIVLLHEFCYFYDKNILKALLSILLVTTFFAYQIFFLTFSLLPLYRFFYVLLLFSCGYKFFIKNDKSHYAKIIKILYNKVHSYKIITYPFLLYIAYGLFSFVYLDNIDSWNIIYVNRLCEGCLITYAIFFLFSIEDIKIFLNKALHFIMIIILTISFGEIFFMVHLPRISKVAIATSYHLPAAFYFNPNDLGFILISMLPFLFYRTEKEYFYIILNHSIIIATIFMIIMSNSRIAIFALLLFFVFTLWTKYRKKMAIICVIFVLTASSALFTSTKLRSLSKQLDNKVSLALNGVKKTSSYQERTTYALLGLKQLLQKPLGHGPGGEKQLLRSHGHTQNFRMHSYWIEQIVNFGWPGFLSLAFFYCYVLLNLYKAYRSLHLYDEEDRYIILSLMMYLLLFPVTSFISSVLIYKKYIMWVFYGFSMVFVTHYINARKDKLSQ